MNPDANVEGEGERGLSLEMRVIVDGEPVAVAVVGHGRLRPPSDWLAKDRGWRDDDLLWWFGEAANVWLDGLFERFPVPEPEQQSLLTSPAGSI